MASVSSLGAIGLLLLFAVVGLDDVDVSASNAAAGRVEVEILKPVAALPAHIAGAFQEISACRQSAQGTYFIFDRRAHSVYTVPPDFSSARKLIEIGAEPGRILSPTAFDLVADGTFVVADAPEGMQRVQIFVAEGSTLGGFLLQDRAVPRITLGNLVLNGIGTIEFTGTTILVSQPETGALVSEYGLNGRVIRTFGELRRTGFESDRDVHLALNIGVIVSNPSGGFYFVFLAGVPQFRKYDASGTLLFERHIEGGETDPLIQALPTTWKRQKGRDGEIPVVPPSVYAAAADPKGNLWVSLAVGTTYIYDPAGDKRRSVQFRAAGVISPTGLSFTKNGQVLVTPGCYTFAGGK